MNWPNDADGDVFRRIQRSNFNFETPCLVDFDVDFQEWPPHSEAIRILEREYPSAKVYEPSSDFNGYVQFQIYGLVTYELVVRTQEHVTKLMGPFGGVCEAWGILHQPK